MASQQLTIGPAMAISSEVEKLERRWNENPSGLTFAPLAEAYRRAGDQQRALEILEVGLTVHPDYVPALIVRGRCHLDSGSLVDAEAAFQQVLARDPANAIALRGMADLCERGGRVPEAIERLELLLEVDRSNSEARADLIRLKSAPAVPDATVPAVSAQIDEDLTLVSLPDEGSDKAVAVPDLPDETDEGALRIENLSVDPMTSEEEPDLPQPEARLPWEPLAMPGWGEPAPEPVESAAVSAAPEELQPEARALPEEVQPEVQPDDDAPVAEEPVVATSNPPLEGLMDVSDLPVTPPETIAEQPAEPMAHRPWDYLLAAPSESQEPAASGVDADRESDEPAIAGAAPVEAAAVESVVSVEMNLVGEAPAEAVGSELAGPVPVAEQGEVAPEATASESPVMNEPVPPESPEAAEIPWPEVAEADQEEVEASVDDLVEAESEEAVAVAEEAALAEPADDPALIVTESMAELFLKQGHRELALAVYRQLLERSPSSDSLLEAIARLENEAAARQAAAPVMDRPSRAASVTGGEPVGAMLQAVLSSPPPASASNVLPPAIEPVAAGEPARPGAEPLTLGQVFGDEPSVPPPAMESEPAPATEPSFDEFFGAPSGGGDTSAPATGSRAADGEDMRQFTHWLKGLKR
jgi:tetratricopeptide (TPR) repeat protein